MTGLWLALALAQEAAPSFLPESAPASADEAPSVDPPSAPAAPQPALEAPPDAEPVDVLPEPPGRTPEPPAPVVPAQQEPPEAVVPAPEEPPHPVEPRPAEPTPAEPTPAEPTPAEPTAAEPTPAEPTPAEPTPAERTPAELTPAEPTTAPEEKPNLPPDPHGLLEPPRQSPVRALLLAAGMALAASVARGVRRTHRRLREGIVATLLQATETIARAALVLLGVGLFAQLVPPSLLPALPWAILAAAAAMGWSLRDALPDLVAWAQLAAEGAVRRGQWVRGDGFAGRVSHVGLRATRIDDGHGRVTAVPNRQLATRPLVSDVQRWPTVEVDVRLPGIEPEVARRALHQAALLSPWIAPRPEIEVAWDSLDPDRWTLRVRLLEGSFADRFRGAFRERLRDLLPR